MREVPLELAQLATPVVVPVPAHPMLEHSQQHLQHKPPSHLQQQQQQRLEQMQQLRSRPPIDPKKVVKSSTAPNLPTSNSLSEMFRVI